MVTVITKNRNEWNNPSETDGIGTQIISMPPEVFDVVLKVPEFSWVLENNSNVCYFAQLNPQFFYVNRVKIKTDKLPKFLVNKDGAIFDLTKKKFIKLGRIK